MLHLSSPLVINTYRTVSRVDAQTTFCNSTFLMCTLQCTHYCALINICGRHFLRNAMSLQMDNPMSYVSRYVACFTAVCSVVITCLFCAVLQCLWGGQWRAACVQIPQCLSSSGWPSSWHQQVVWVTSRWVYALSLLNTDVLMEHCLQLPGLTWWWKDDKLLSVITIVLQL